MVEVQQTALWRVMLNKFSLILSLFRKIYLEAFRSQGTIKGALPGQRVGRG